MSGVRIGVILAGGRARRMEGGDKGCVALAGKRLFEHVWERFRPQVERVLIAGPHDYGAAVVALRDHPNGPAGPAAGLYATVRWLADNAPDVDGFVTAPVDAPFLPLDLARRLCAEQGSAVARCAERRHPTFACWGVRDLSDYFQTSVKAPALHDIARAVKARDVAFAEPDAFFNINTQADLGAAETRIAEKRGLTP